MPHPPEANPHADTIWKKAYQLFEAAVSLPSEERVAFAREATQDPEVLRLALHLIDQAEGASSNEDESRGESGSYLKPGARIGRYEIQAQLGRGGMGQVYSARDTELGRMVALKVLAPDVVVTPKALDRLIREAKAASALNHPHIVTVYEVLRDGTNLAVVMELVEGEPLRNFCGQAQPVERVIHWGRQIAKALAATHQHQVVHRDIKPENLMVRADEYVKLLDFGLARQSFVQGTASVSNLSGILAGTLNYMSPEQTRGEAVSSASDIFSLGIVLYELVTGKHPFRVVSPIDTAHAIATIEPKNPANLNRAIPWALNSLLLAMLAKDAKRRPSASEVDLRLGEIDAGAAGPTRGLGLRIAAILFVSAAAAALVVWRGRDVPVRQLQLTPLTTQESDNGVTEAALSPDGTNLAFATRNGSLQLRRISDGSTRPLQTPPASSIDRIAWFPGGTRLLVSVSRNLDEKAGIWEVSTGTEAPRQVLADFINGIPSPDGTQIAVTNPDGTAIRVIDLGGGPAKYVRGGGATTLFSSLIWSPDGKRVSYQRQDYAPPRDRQIDNNSVPLLKNFVYSYESAEVGTGRVVASEAGVVMNSACSLRDGRVLFLRWISFERPADREIWELRTDPHSGKLLGPARPFAHAKALTLSDISASEDGNHIVVVNWTASSARLNVADLSPAGEPVRLLNIRTLTATDDFPHGWTPDSRAVIFESGRFHNFDLFTQEINQKEAKPLVVAPGENVLAQVSSDGQWVLYRSMYKGVNRLMRVPLRGGKPEPVPVQGLWDEFSCPFLPGKPCVLRTVENDQFIFHALDPVRGQGGELGRTVWGPTILGDWELSPDGSEVAIPDHEAREARFRLVPLGRRTRAREETTVALPGLSNLIAVHWTADGQGWFASVSRSVQSDRAEGRTLVYADHQGRSYPLFRSQGTIYAVPSRDGRHLAFPEEISPSNVWAVRGN